MSVKQILLFTFLVLTHMLQGQKYWFPFQPPNAIVNKYNDVNHSQFLSLDTSTLKLHLWNASEEFQVEWSAANTIFLPLADGTLSPFAVLESSIVKEGFAKKHPEIKTFIAQSKDKKYTARIDWTKNGLHAYISGGETTQLIDPIKGSKTQYIVYDLNQLNYKSSISCATEALSDAIPIDESIANQAIGEELRILEMAISTTGEFARASITDTEDPLSVVITLTNRLNAIYERDLSLRFVLVDNNDQLIFSDPDTDPFNNRSGTILSDNVEILDSIIGRENYDIGHVISADITGGIAGQAILAGVCSSTKGAAVSSFFDSNNDVLGAQNGLLETFAHEVGHQLGASHTWNSCGNANQGQRSSSSAVEPGSGTTIMSYSGACGSDNISPSIQYFHGFSIMQMNQLLSSVSCEEEIATGNIPPNITILHPEGLYIPINTPFELTAAANDPNDDLLTYSWEQFDLGSATALGFPAGSAPSFTTLLPDSSGNRILPKRINLLLNREDIAEVLPFYERDFEFRVVVRDNNPNGGGVTQKRYKFSSTEQASNFRINILNERGSELNGQQEIDVLWEVGNTDQPPVNCNAVDILLSYNNGLTYPDTLAHAAPNTGIATVVVPNKATRRGRLKVKAANNIFFDISDQFFTILEDDLTNTNDESFTKFTIAPNPSNEYVFIQLPKQLSNTASLTLWNINGELLKKIAPSKQQIKLDLSIFPSSMYFLKLEDENGFWVEKVIKK